MNTDLLQALAYMELAKRSLERANKVLWLDNAMDELETALRGVRDDADLEAKRLNVRVLPVREVA